jgi:hypothetical protein
LVERFALGVIARSASFRFSPNSFIAPELFVPNPRAENRFPLFRFDIPFVGETLVVAGILLVGTIAAFLLYIYQNNETAKKSDIFA